MKKKHFTFHHYWGAFCPGGFCPVPNIYIVKPVLRGHLWDKQKVAF